MTRRALRTQPGSEDTVAALRHLHDTEGLAAFAELIEGALDHRAGPYALTDTERADRRACRERYGHYNPSSSWQQAYLRRLHADAELVAA